MANAKQNKKSGQKVYLTFDREELTKFGLDADAKPVELRNLIRKKFGLPAIVSSKSSKSRELRIALGLPEDAKQSEVNKAALARVTKK
jgi:hypothetical protein